MGLNPSITVYSAFDPTGLLLPLGGFFPIKITLVSGQVGLRGDLLGKITSGGKFTKSLSASSDGSQVPKVILLADCDASGGDVTTAWAYKAGHFDANKINFGSAHTAASTREALAELGIYTYDSQPMI